MILKEQEEKNSEIKKPRKRQQITVGSILEIPIKGEYYAYGQILPMNQCAFFDFRSDTPLKDFEVLNDAPILFVLTIYREIITTGDWLKVGKLPIRKDLETLPLQFMYRQATGKFRHYNPATGEMTPCTREEAIGLEIAAVWDDFHIVDRIYDHYNGNKCVWTQYMDDIFK